MKPTLKKLGGDEGQGKLNFHSFIESTYTSIVAGMIVDVSTGPS